MSVFLVLAWYGATRGWALSELKSLKALQPRREMPPELCMRRAAQQAEELRTTARVPRWLDATAWLWRRWAHHGRLGPSHRAGSSVVWRDAWWRNVVKAALSVASYLERLRLGRGQRMLGQLGWDDAIQKTSEACCGTEVPWYEAAEHRDELRRRGQLALR